MRFEKIPLLKVAAVLNILLAVGHIICIPWLDEAFKLYGIDNLMNQISLSYGEYIPYIITIIIATCFALCALYALSADGVIRKLPLLWLAIFTIASIFLLRGTVGSFSMIKSGLFTMANITSAIIAEIIGFLYLIGGIQKINKK